jgi:hypothetical protein
MQAITVVTSGQEKSYLIVSLMCHTSVVLTVLKRTWVLFTMELYCTTKSQHTTVNYNQ